MQRLIASPADLEQLGHAHAEARQRRAAVQLVVPAKLARHPPGSWTLTARYSRTLP